MLALAGFASEVYFAAHTTSVTPMIVTKVCVSDKFGDASIAISPAVAAAVVDPRHAVVRVQP
jgi:hypothetical protein